MLRLRRLGSLCGLFALLAAMGMTADGGCQGPDFSSLAGLYSIERGSIETKFTFTVNNGGEVTQTSTGGELEPLDPADFPEVLADLVAQWNAGLDDLNAAVDESMPDEIVATFPAAFQMHIVNNADWSKNGTGLINENAQYGFAVILGGAGEGSAQGGGGVLDVSSIEGSFDVNARTTQGKVVRRLIVGLIGSNNDSLSFVAEIWVNYTGERIGDVPTTQPADDDDDSNADSNANDNAP